MTHEQRAHAPDSVAFGVVSVAPSTATAPDCGDTLTDAIEATGNTVSERVSVTPYALTLREHVEALRMGDAVDALVTAGGAGVRSQDVAASALRLLFDREIPGFGEYFRAQWVATVGPELHRRCGGSHRNVSPVWSSALRVRAGWTVDLLRFRQKRLCAA